MRSVFLISLLLYRGRRKPSLRQVINMYRYADILFSSWYGPSCVRLIAMQMHASIETFNLENVRIYPP